jgi:hypothetical protein
MRSLILDEGQGWLDAEALTASAPGGDTFHE